ncbi:MAG: ArsA family ATPase [Clostridia bacterium]|nr:ArsA family ATPase [Clostridia bacterium]
MAEIIFFGGKGGVGKTSCSSAFSLEKSKCKKVLLISTDPAHSTSDLFNMKIGSEITKIKDNLFGLEIDPEKESNAYIEGIKNNMHRIISPIIMDEMNQQLDAARISPGAHESALFDKMVEIILNEYENYDFIIFDTAPTGHTIRLLSLPEMLEGWINTLLKKRRKTLALKAMVDRIKGIDKEDDPVVQILKQRQKKLNQARALMMDEKNLSFYFVLNAERLPIEETKKAVKLLKQYKIPVKGLVINRLLPEHPEESFWIEKKKQEVYYLDEIHTSFQLEKMYKIPLFETDMHENSIQKMSNYFNETPEY